MLNLHTLFVTLGDAHKIFFEGFTIYYVYMLNLWRVALAPHTKLSQVENGQAWAS